MDTPMLDVRSATKTYFHGLGNRQGSTVLRDVDLSFPEKPARIIALAGESGSGKTTLASAILGFTRLTSGSVLFRGKDVSRDDISGPSLPLTGIPTDSRALFAYRRFPRRRSTRCSLCRASETRGLT